jgi:hypothetical protein
MSSVEREQTRYEVSTGTGIKEAIVPPERWP